MPCMLSVCLLFGLSAFVLCLPMHGPSCSAGLSSVTAMNCDFFPEELQAWGNLHLTRLSLTSSYELTLSGLSNLLQWQRNLVGKQGKCRTV